MTAKHHQTDQQEYSIGEFKVSKSAVESSNIGGPEDILTLATAHWKIVAVVVGFVFIVSSYQGRIDTLEDQVGSLRNIYAGLPEEKALAVDALRSVGDLRDALTVIVEERTVELIESEGLFRGGTDSERRIRDLGEISAGFRKLWLDREEEPPSIYQVVESLARNVSRGEAAAGLLNVPEVGSKTAFAVARYLLAHHSVGGADLSNSVAYLRDAARTLSHSTVVRGKLISFELALGNSAFSEGERESLISTYKQWWPQWDALLNMDESPETEYRVASGLARSLVFPIYALSLKGEGQALSLDEFESAIGHSFPDAIRIGLLKVREAENLSVDRLPTLMIAAKLDIALGEALSNDSIELQQRLQAWNFYQSVTGQFQGVSLELAKQTLIDRAYQLLFDASGVATSHGEQLDYSDLVIGDALVDVLPDKYRVSLGLVARSAE